MEGPLRTGLAVLALACLQGPGFAARLPVEGDVPDPAPSAAPPGMANASPDKIRRFFASKPYLERRRTNEQFLNDVYRVALGRSPDPQGYADWLRALADPKTERGWVVRKFLESAEYRQKRPKKPEPPKGPCAASDALASRLRFDGPSYFTKREYTDLKRSDHAFLKDAYCLLLQRAPDAKGFESWLAFLKKGRADPSTRGELIARFVKSPEYVALSAGPADGTRHPGNSIFDKPGLFINSAEAFPVSTFAPEGGTDLPAAAKIGWIALQIDNGGQIREDNAAAVRAGWADRWRARGYRVGFWGVPRGAGYDARKLAPSERQAALETAAKDVAADARLAAKLSVDLKADFYIADCEGPFQDGQGDPALNAAYVDAFSAAAPKTLPRALSSMGRVALAMEPWLKGGWDAMPQAYWNAYAHYKPSLSVEYYLGAGWPLSRIHPTIATYRGEGEDREVSLGEYAADLGASKAPGFSYYLPESYLGTDAARWRELGAFTR